MPVTPQTFHRCSVLYESDDHFPFAFRAGIGNYEHLVAIQHSVACHGVAYHIKCKYFTKWQLPGRERHIRFDIPFCKDRVSCSNLA
jgi:hypothetical protein